MRLGPSEIVAAAMTANSSTQPCWEPTWEPSGRTTSPARRTSADKRLAIMPGGEPIRTALNAIQVTTDQKAGGSNPSERAIVMSQDIGDRRAAGRVVDWSAGMAIIASCVRRSWPALG
jgi:hypothetical protein